jgi:hypothetical protein
MLVWDGPILYSLRQGDTILSGEVEQLGGQNRHNLPGSGVFRSRFFKADRLQE